MRSYFLFALLSATVSIAHAQSNEGMTTQFPALKQETGRLVINGAADTSALKPLVLDFQETEPNIAVEYTDFVTNDLYREADLACRGESNFGDLLMSSSVDQMVKLANDGCALPHVSSQTRATANQTNNWRNEVYGFTFEPSVIVYHSDYVLPQDVPRTRGELADLLRRKQDYYKEHVATYDLRQSGVGYLLAFLDAKQNSTAYGRLLESMSRVDTQLRCCNNSILEDIEDRKIYIGYNIIGSYAYAASLRNPKLKIVLPRDYTLVLSRATFIPRKAKHPELAARFIDYLLSERGRRVAREKAFFFSQDGALPAGVDGPPSLIESGVGRPVKIGPALLATQDAAQRKRFIDDWTNVMVTIDEHVKN
ncbi:ABC transporter substrate-binding protein [Pseudochrobactrum asaccharolyticum]|uniref:Iron(III) transport system substrate-binding protein n=1 Tax=Pseudochrobactrum asaccharolyticum TaxID=354351 RepID=A0A366DZP5_9HYPH|nr:ABC transporter substrate-binding protein [Pseudochrobactrum asaccharolyticum]MBX8800272.1 ABC transporter substrate-binding protein [Ochrobactrum sp. MR28]MBX8815884.1 ABC transporter substrate-binding protein [Ochrobactrum sp. MR31]RBO95533.1 iron(III) transport system substrate-binding protein [Pseudochrobactrum asaccharolyticum]